MIVSHVMDGAKIATRIDDKFSIDSDGSVREKG